MARLPGGAGAEVSGVRRCRVTVAYPLQWPEGWRRTPSYERKRGAFGRQETVRGQHSSWQTKKDISIAEAVKRVRLELDKLGVEAVNDAVVSTNLKLNMSGIPRGDQGEPGNPGAAVYWKKAGQPMRVMAIDAYSRVAQNIAAIAATLEAMRAIDRHGGAQILDRAFAGFDALPPPRSCWDVLGVYAGASVEEINQSYRAKARAAHPDAGGSAALMAELNQARDEALKQCVG